MLHLIAITITLAVITGAVSFIAAELAYNLDRMIVARARYRYLKQQRAERHDAR